MIKNKLKKIIDLTKIFLKDSYQNMNLINKEKNKINKKSVYVWGIVIICLALFYISNEIISKLRSIGQESIFLNIYFLILTVLIIFQTILVCTNIFYFSKDIEFILPLPIKSEELLIAKFCTLVCTLYISEIIFGIIPISMYGILTNATFLFFIYEFLIFATFPIFLAIGVSIIMMFVMKISKFIKNKDLFQVIITLLLLIVMFLIEYKCIGSIFLDYNQSDITTEQQQIIERIEEFNNRIKISNKYFLVVNPSIKILEKNDFKSILELIKIILIDIISFGIFIFIGKITYLKDILKNTAYLKNNKNKKINLYKKSKRKNIGKSYMIKEFKSLFRNPMFFMQCVYPVLIFLVTIIIMSVILVPKLEELFNNEEFIKSIGSLSFDLSVVYLILGGIQILFMISITSLTAISREGKQAIVMKYLPISYYKQFIYKGIPQIFINMISIIVILSLVFICIPSINVLTKIIMFILAILLNIINSYSMLIVDLIRPKLEWDTEYEVFKQNNNKIFQYAFSVIIILLLMYFNNIFKDVEINTALMITALILLILIILILFIVKKIENKLLNKIK